MIFPIFIVTVVLGLEGGYQFKDGSASGNLQDAILNALNAL